MRPVACTKPQPNASATARPGRNDDIRNKETAKQPLLFISKVRPSRSSTVRKSELNSTASDFSTAPCATRSDDRRTGTYPIPGSPDPETTRLPRRISVTGRHENVRNTGQARPVPPPHIRPERAASDAVALRTAPPENHRLQPSTKPSPTATEAFESPIPPPPTERQPSGLPKMREAGRRMKIGKRRNASLRVIATAF